MDQSLIIAGGGIGGTAAALALHRAGLPFRLYERAPAFTEVGAGVSLWPNATRVLKSWGMLEQLMALGEPVTRFNLFRSSGRMISSICVGGFATPALCLHRADLHRCLREPLPADCIEGGQRLLSFTPEPGGVTAKFASGVEVSAAGLIGADGINSTVRTQLHGSAAPAYRGYCIWRGVVPDIGGFVRGHISETWGAGRRFGIMPIGRGRICWYATRNGPPSQEDAPAGRKEEVLHLFKDWHPPIPALITATEPSMIIKNDAEDRPPLRRWGNGCVTLLGDAAHPITPNVGQGACMAIEDAACLVKGLLTASTVAAGFGAYEAMRKRRTAFIGRQARRIGAIGQWENQWMVNGRNLVAGLFLSHTAETRLNAVYDYEV